jgi:hypothetical protein
MRVIYPGAGIGEIAVKSGIPFDNDTTIISKKSIG